MFHMLKQQTDWALFSVCIGKSHIYASRIVFPLNYQCSTENSTHKNTITIHWGGETHVQLKNMHPHKVKQSKFLKPKILKKSTYISMKAAMSFWQDFKRKPQDAMSMGRGNDPTGLIKHATIVMRKIKNATVARKKEQHNRSVLWSSILKRVIWCNALIRSPINIFRF